MEDPVAQDPRVVDYDVDLSELVDGVLDDALGAGGIRDAVAVRDGAPAGAAVIAESQTAGRGRLGRSFFSPPNQNLYASIVLRPKLSIAEAPTLILAGDREQGLPVVVEVELHGGSPLSAPRACAARAWR